MRLSLWQQFSSNHSASFTTVGQFETEEMAHLVAIELRDMIRQIGSWWEQFDTSDARTAVEEQLKTSGKILTPPEQRIQRQYDVEWCRYAVTGNLVTLDWIRDQSDDYAVQQFRNIVVVKPSQTWCGAHPFDLILQKLGGNIASDVEDFSFVTLDITFAAPRPDTAELIQREMWSKERQYGTIIRIPGWGNAAPGKIVSNGAQFSVSNLYLRWAGVGGSILTNFEKLLTWLEQHHCTKIQYQFHQHSIEESL